MLYYDGVAFNVQLCYWDLFEAKKELDNNENCLLFFCNYSISYNSLCRPCCPAKKIHTVCVYCQCNSFPWPSISDTFLGFMWVLHLNLTDCLQEVPAVEFCFYRRKEKSTSLTGPSHGHEVFVPSFSQSWHMMAAEPSSPSLLHFSMGHLPSVYSFTSACVGVQMEPRSRNNSTLMGRHLNQRPYNQ